MTIAQGEIAGPASTKRDERRAAIDGLQLGAAGGDGHASTRQPAHERGHDGDGEQGAAPTGGSLWDRRRGLHLVRLGDRP